MSNRKDTKMIEIQSYHTYTHNADITNILLNRYIRKNVTFYYIFLN